MVCRPLLTIALILTFLPGWLRAADNEARDPETRRSASSGEESSEVRADPPEQPSAEDAVDRAKSDAVDESRPALALTGRSPRVLFIINKGCDRCARELARLRRPGGDFEAMRSRGWKIGESDESHLQIIDRTEIPTLVSQLNIREYPTVACVEDGEIVRSFKDGCTTPLDSWTFGWLLKGTNERPQAPVPEPIRVESTGSYRLRGNHWSVDGDWSPARDKLVSHLRGPNHGGQLASNWRIEGWSYEELRSLHDDLHERELGSSSSAGSAGYGGESYSSGRSGSEFGAARKALGR